MNRFRKYVYRSWALLRQNPLFSSIYILGTALSVALLMVLFIIFYVKFAPIYPEGNRNRTLVLQYVQANDLSNPGSYSGGALSPRVPYELLKGLPHLDATAAVYRTSAAKDDRVALTMRSAAVPVSSKYVDGGFWRVFTFRFLSGKPFSDADVTAAMPVAVLSARLANRIFGTTEVVGRQFLFNGNELKVAGVVQDVSWVTPATAADVWLPLSLNPNALWETGDERLRGNLEVYLTAPKPSDKDALRKEVREAFRRYNTTCRLYENDILDQPDDYWKSCFRSPYAGDACSSLKPYLEATLRPFFYFLLALIFIPALNLGGIIASRMDSRIGELGIRKAYGASNLWLLRQIMNENLLFTSLGSLLGLLLSYLCLWLSSDWILTILDKYTDPTMPAPEFTAGMLLQPAVFVVVVCFCLLLNFLSALVPALLSLRKSIVEQLQQKR